MANRHSDETSQAMIYEGVNVAQLCRIFKQDSRDIKAKILGKVEPVASRSGNDLYDLAEAAKYIVTPPYDIDEFIQKMTVADLPMLIRKEFWAAQRSRQIYETQAAELWKTDDVVNVVTTLFSTLRQSLLISREVVERETELTAKQRKILTNLIDSALEEAHGAITRTFSGITRPSADVQSTESSGSEDL